MVPPLGLGDWKVLSRAGFREVICSFFLGGGMKSALDEFLEDMALFRSVLEP